MSGAVQTGFRQKKFCWLAKFEGKKEFCRHFELRGRVEIIHFHFLDFVLIRETFFLFKPAAFCIKHHVYYMYMDISTLFVLLQWIIFTGAVYPKGFIGQQMYEHTLRGV